MTNPTPSQAAPEAAAVSEKVKVKEISPIPWSAWQMPDEDDPEDEPWPIWCVAHRDTSCASTTVCNVFNEADAHLIAASPELLASCCELWPLFESCIAQGNGELEGDREAIARAKAAIAKAKGVQP